jgi:hypothetical protein
VIGKGFRTGEDQWNNCTSMYASHNVYCVFVLQCKHQTCSGQNRRAPEIVVSSNSSVDLTSWNWKRTIISQWKVRRPILIPSELLRSHRPIYISCFSNQHITHRQVIKTHKVGSELSKHDKQHNPHCHPD